MEPTAARASRDLATGSRRLDPGLIAAVVLLVTGSLVALSIDVPRTLGGIKGDEATYVAMALSLAHDGDLVYERQDEERFFSVYNGGPSGIYLKKGVRSSFEVDGAFPFIHRNTSLEDRDDRLYFGKAYLSSVFAAPFVWVAGLNGLLWFNVVLLAAVVFVAYRFIAARAPVSVALPYALAFVGASIAPLYVVWLSSEVFNFSLVFFAYFLWFYKEGGRGPDDPDRAVAPSSEQRPRRCRPARIGGVLQVHPGAPHCAAGDSLVEAAPVSTWRGRGVPCRRRLVGGVRTERRHHRRDQLPEWSRPEVCDRRIPVRAWHQLG